MKPEESIKKMQKIKAKIQQAQEYRKAWGQVIKELKAQLFDLIDGSDIEQIDMFNRLPPRPEVDNED